MNGEAHKLVALRINQKLKNRFPVAQLLQGSVDPDEKKYGIYRGDEYKHHFDNKSLGSSRNDEEVICRVVWNRVYNARQAWLAGKKDRAAFHYGVATHFFMDGLIVSPSVNELQHEKGDRDFSRDVKRWKGLQMSAPEVAGRSLAVQALRQSRRYFGCNNSKVIGEAAQLLFTLGSAVTEDSTPQKLVDAGQQQCQELSGELKRLLADCTHSTHEELSQQPRLLRIVTQQRMQARPILPAR